MQAAAAFHAKDQEDMLARAQQEAAALRSKSPTSPRMKRAQDAYGGKKDEERQKGAWVRRGPKPVTEPTLQPPPEPWTHALARYGGDEVDKAVMQRRKEPKRKFKPPLKPRGAVGVRDANGWMHFKPRDEDIFFDGEQWVRDEWEEPEAPVSPKPAGW